LANKKKQMNRRNFIGFLGASLLSACGESIFDSKKITLELSRMTQQINSTISNLAFQEDLSQNSVAGIKTIEGCEYRSVHTAFQANILDEPTPAISTYYICSKQNNFHTQIPEHATYGFGYAIDTYNDQGYKFIQSSYFEEFIIQFKDNSIIFYNYKGDSFEIDFRSNTFIYYLTNVVQDIEVSQFDFSFTHLTKGFSFEPQYRKSLKNENKINLLDLEFYKSTLLNIPK